MSAGNSLRNKIISWGVVIAFCLSVAANIPTGAQTSTNQSDEYFFDIVFLVRNDTKEHQRNPERILANEKIVEELRSIKINATIVYVNDFNYFENHTYNQDTYPYRTYNESGFDMYLVGLADSILTADPPSVLGIDRGFGYLDGQDMAGYIDFDYKYLVDQFYDEFNETKRLAIFDEIQQKLYNDLPVISISESELLGYGSANTRDLEELFLGLTSGEGKFLWSNHDFGQNEFSMLGLSSAVTPYDELNFELSFTKMWNRVITNMIYESLYQLNISDSTWVPVLAEDFPEWNFDHKIATIKLRNDAYFADGHPVLAEDVVNSYMMYLRPCQELLDARVLQPQYLRDYDIYKEFFNSNLDFVKALNDTAVQFVFTKSHSRYLTLLSKNIMPSHAYGSFMDYITNNVTGNRKLVNDFITYGYSNLTFGSGPFKIADVNINEDGDFVDKVTLEAVENYWRGQPSFSNLTYIWDSTNDYDTFFEMMQNGTVDIALPYPFLFGLNITTVPIKTYTSSGFLIYLLVPNLMHPIFGTGVNTPLGRSDPSDSSKAKEAAKLVRRAISHIIPREAIVNELYQGLGTPVGIPISQYDPGFNSTLYDAYDKELAMQYLFDAGYGNPKYESKSEPLYRNPYFIGGIASTFFVTAVVVYKFTSFRLKNPFKKELTTEDAQKYIKRAKKLVEPDKP